MKLRHISGISEGLLNEAGLSRLLAHAVRPFVILTAFRGNFSLKQNRNRNKQLEQKFREIGPLEETGAIKLIGYYQEEKCPENQGGCGGDVSQFATGDPCPHCGREIAPNREESYFVTMPPSMLLTDFMGWTQSVLQEFDQDAAIFSIAPAPSLSATVGLPSLPQNISPGIWLLWKEYGEEMTHLGNKITVGKIAQAYSVIKGKPFIFEGTMHPSCNAHRMGLDLRGVQW